MPKDHSQSIAGDEYVSPLAASPFDWPTIAVAIAIYGVWLALTWWHAALPLPVLALVGGVIIAWHGSLQHETIHGHPTANSAINAAFGLAPLALWLPYSIYRRSHLAHHATVQTTDPLEDPESHYCSRPNGWRYRFALLEATLAGRLLFGPLIRISSFLRAEMLRAWSSPAAWFRDWWLHLILLAILVAWLDYVELPLGTYLLTFVYPGTALSLLRSFAEHRADSDRSRRAAIIPGRGPLALIFLNNNFHAVHHARPDLAWYRLPAYFKRNLRAFAAAPHYQGYYEVFCRFALCAQDEVVHPDYRQKRSLAQ